jgi:nondiscriminating aspartyl-tRNA synthetase
MLKDEERTLILDAAKKVGEEVVLCGWVSVVRDHGKITFLDLLDRSGVIQVVVTPEVLPGALRQQDVLSITGMVKERPEKLVNPNLATGKVEIEAKKIEILSKAQELPFDMNVKSLELQLPTLLDYRTLTLRHPKVKEIFKVQEAVMEGFRKASKDLSCTEIFVPTISASATEGGAEVFKVDYYGRQAFMTQSPQLYKQMLVPTFERVFTISHAYRAEPSITTRHLAESTQLDCEFGFVDFDTLLDYLEYVGKETVDFVNKTCGEILKDYGVEEIKFGKEIPRLKMREAQKIILERTGVDHTNEKDLGPEDEREISKWAFEKYGSDLVTVTHYPTKKRAFYSMADPKDPEFSLSYDLLFRGVEILSGSQRINDYDQLVEAIKERGMNPKNFEMYLQAFKYGMPPEGGFSFGLERLTMQILGLGNIREASLFPRDMERVDVRLSSVAKK